MTDGSLSTPEIVPQIELTSCYRTLVVHFSPSGTTTESFTILKEKSVVYASAVISSRLSKEEAYWSYILFVSQK
jgi:hypothetical protein